MRENLNYLILFFIVVLFAGGALATEDISVSSRISDSEIAYEDEVSLTVELKWIGDIRSYKFSLVPLPTTDNLKVAGSKSTISSAVENGLDVTIRKFEYSFQPTMAGSASINPITFDYVSMPDSTPGQLTTQSFNILIAEPVPKTVETESNFVIYIIIAAIFIIGGGATFFIIRSRSGQIEKEVPIEENFVKQLEEIKKENHADRKTFFGKLYQLLLWYFENKFSLEVTGKTVQSIIDELMNEEEISVKIDNRERIIEILKQSDREKFAPSRGEPGDILRLCAELESYFGKINDKNISEAK